MERHICRADKAGKRRDAQHGSDGFFLGDGEAQRDKGGGDGDQNDAFAQIRIGPHIVANNRLYERRIDRAGLFDGDLDRIVQAAIFSLP